MGALKVMMIKERGTKSPCCLLEIKEVRRKTPFNSANNILLGIQLEPLHYDPVQLLTLTPDSSRTVYKG